jgi:hypothetical protein
MKYLKTKIVLSVFILATVFISGCTKEKEPVKTQKELTTLALTADVKADSLKKFVQWMEGMGTRWALADNHRDIAVKIKNKFIQLGYPSTTLDSFQITKTYKSVVYQQWQYNVIASLNGSITPDSICIVGAHYDNSISRTTADPFLTTYGANDNASGVAAALEIARVIKKNSYTPKNTIRFIAFGAEELGLLGSYYESGKLIANFEKIKMMLNNDMIAYEPTSVGGNWFVDIIDYDNSHELRLQAQGMADKYTVLSHINNNTVSRQSDSYPFSLNGFPALFFFGVSSDPNYHTLNDISANCNFDYCREVVNISVALLVNGN